MNLNYNEFINNVVERLYYWILYYNENYRNTPIAKEKYGIYAEFKSNYDYCSNTGIYSEMYMKEDIKYRGYEYMLFEGFNWTKEKFRIELDKVILKIWKENEIICKLKSIEEDFK